MTHRPTALRCLFVLLVAAVVGAPAQAAKTGYSTGFARWRADDGGFAGWALTGAALAADGALELDPATAQAGTDPYPPGGYYGHNYYNGGTFVVGEATGPIVETPFAFTEAIASWNAETPPGTWIETLIRAQAGDHWTKWYNLGVWAADTATVERHSVNLQGDADGYVAVDTLVLSPAWPAGGDSPLSGTPAGVAFGAPAGEPCCRFTAAAKWGYPAGHAQLLMTSADVINSDKKAPATAFQLKLRLFSAGGQAIPRVCNASVAYSTTAGKVKTVTAGNPALWNRVLDVPECSQMVYPDGGNVWCSPTSTSMVLGYWGVDPGPCEPRVRAAVAGVYDWLYDGHGNWPFNTAYAASRGLEAYVARFTGLDQAEPWIAAGVPVVMGIAWKKSTLSGAPVASSDGHLIVLVGFDAAGNPVVNDPAAADNESVRRTYDRAELESVWLENSGGTVYLIYTAGTAVPPLPAQ